MKTKEAKTPVGLIFLLYFLPVLVLSGAVASLLHLHEKQRSAESITRAAEVSQYELKRMTSTFNYRLNELREELAHLYGEQANLARALNEAERERLIFYRRDHLAAYAVLVKNKLDEWELQKYYLRAQASADAQKVSQVTQQFKEVVTGLQPTGFALKRLEAKPFSPSWTGSDAYAVGFMSTDEAGKPFGFVGIYRPSYVFPMCKFFTESLGAMPVHAFVLDEKGQAVCHSQPKFESTSFKDYALYTAITGVASADGAIKQVRYSNIANANATASVRKVQNTNLTFVVEALEVSPWGSFVPHEQLLMAVGAVLGATLLSALGMSWLVARLRRRWMSATVKTQTMVEGEAVATDSLGVELSEFTKLRHELKELEATVLEMQAMQAFAAGFQKAAVELPTESDLAGLMLDYLAVWQTPIAWLPVVRSGGMMRVESGQYRQWPESEKIAGFSIELPQGLAPDELARDSETRRRVGEKLGRGDLIIQAVYFLDDHLGFLVLAGPGGQAELLPQIAQIYAYVHKARRANLGAGEVTGANWSMLGGLAPADSGNPA